MNVGVEQIRTYQQYFIRDRRSQDRMFLTDFRQQENYCAETKIESLFNVNLQHVGSICEELCTNATTISQSSARRPACKYLFRTSSLSETDTNAAISIVIVTVETDCKGPILHCVVSGIVEGHDSVVNIRDHCVLSKHDLSLATDTKL